MKIRYAALTAALLLALTGCSAAPASPEPNYPASEAAETPASETVAPLVAETVEPLSVEPTQAVAVDDSPEGKFLARIRTALADTELESATDAQLLATADEACAQLAEGVPYKDVQVIEGEVRGNEWYPYSSSFVIIGGTFLCSDDYPSDAPRVD